MKRLAFVYTSILIFSLCGKNVSAQIASGFHNPTFGALGFAQGSAFSARANDASAIVYNPAGLTQLERPQISLGASFIYGKVDYHGDGISDEMNSYDIVPNMFFASPIIEDKFAVGLGITAPYGLGGGWEEDGFSRYTITDFFLSVININPTLTYKPFSFLSVGVGLDYYYAKTDLENRLNVGLINASLTGIPIDTSTSDGFQDFDDLHGDGLGYNIGILWNITERNSVGISFRSKADLDLKGKTKFSNLSGAIAEVFGSDSFSTQTKTRATLPEMLTFGYAYRHGDRWSIEADIQWTNWSRFDVLNFHFNPTNSLLDASNKNIRNWDNTLGFALGGEYKLSEAIKLRGGYFFHESPVPSNTFEPAIAQSSRHGLTTGIGYSWGKKLNKWIDFAYGEVFYENRKVNNSVGDNIGGPIDGDYDTFNHIVLINFNYQF
ncbi:MAG: transporter [Planctomycetes bacterium]|nr:transporter [Planctomycetota bacterium]